MPQLPTLRTDFNVIAPDIKNALLAGRKMKEESEDKANVLLDRSIATEKRKLDTSTSKSQSLMNISKAAMGTDTELVKKLVSIHNQTYEDAKTDVPEQIGPIQKLKLGRITFEGTADGIQNLIDLQLKHPGVTPEDDVDLPTPDGNVVKVKFKSLLARAAVRNKVNLSVEEPKRTDAEEIEYQGKLAEEKDPEFKKRIDQYMKVNPGLSEKDATDIILGTKKLSTNPVSGEKSVVDMQTNISESVKDAPIATEQTSEKEKKKPETTLWELSGLSTGPWSSMRAGASLVSGALGGPVAEQTLRARQFTTSAQNDLIRALTLNKRFPVGEINRLKDDMAIEPNFFDNPKMLQQRYIAIEKYLKDRVIKEIDASSNTSLPKDVRQDALRAANSIDNFVNLLGVPDQSDTTPEEVAVTITSDADFDNLESGTLFIGPDNVKRRKP